MSPALWTLSPPPFFLAGAQRSGDRPILSEGLQAWQGLNSLVSERVNEGNQACKDDLARAGFGSARMTIRPDVQRGEEEMVLRRMDESALFPQ